MKSKQKMNKQVKFYENWWNDKMNDDAECVLNLLRHTLKMLRAEKNQKQREIFEIDSRIEDITHRLYMWNFAKYN